MTKVISDGQHPIVAMSANAYSAALKDYHEWVHSDARKVWLCLEERPQPQVEVR